MKLIPDFVLRRISHRPKLVAVVDNISWLFFDKFLRLGIALFVGVWVARYLGPNQYGQLSFALAFVSLVGGFSALGLNSIAVREIVRHPIHAGQTLGTAFVLQLMGGVTAYALMAVLIFWLRPDDEVARLLVLLVGVGVVLKSSDVIRSWFESQVQSRYCVWVDNVVVVLTASIKIGLILTGAPVAAFAAVVVVESALIASGLFAVYASQTHALSRWSVDRARGLALLKQAWPLMLSSIAVMVYMRIDQVMLGQMVGNDAVGLYAAALRISEVWYMVPMIIAASLFPSILESKLRNETLYRDRIQKMLDVLSSVALLVTVMVIVAGTPLIVALFGDAYKGAAPVLKIHICASVFVFMGVGSGKWLIAEGLEMFTFYRATLGAVLNVSANFFLIPIYGATGAALATLVSWAVAAYFFDLLFRKTRRMFLQKTLSLIAPVRYLRSARARI